jgi:hypothetical protein
MSSESIAFIAGYLMGSAMTYWIWCKKKGSEEG